MTFVAGHFGEWMQGRLGPDGAVVLITLACPGRGVRVTRQNHDGPVGLTGAPLVSAARASRLFKALGCPVSGTFHIEADFPPGGGAGMSTAALVALARSAGAKEEEIASACLGVEGASDPLMHPAPDSVLWASREAKAVRSMGLIPACDIIGGFWGQPERTDPQDRAFPDISDLIEAWPQADLAGKAQLSSLSAERANALRGHAGDPTARLAGELGALGHARAYTGSARALIFAPGTAPAHGAEAMLRAGMTGVLQFATGGPV